jgi:ADP-ribosylglycohydrolase
MNPTAPNNHVKAALFGLAVGDAQGVPAEFLSREHFKQNPITGMTGYGSHNMPPGTFSDDSSLAFCLAEALTEDFSLQTIANNFIKWRYNNFWTATGTVFDIGTTTANAIDRLKKGTVPELAGGFYEEENGNGSLMRILPLVFYIKNKPVEDRFTITRFVSSITHGHIRSVIACFYYLEYARLLMQGKNKFEAYQYLKAFIATRLRAMQVNPKEIAKFSGLLADDIFKLPEVEIKSSGYVLHTLEASLWCLLTTDSYREAVLKAVNLGSDTDTTATVTGGLAGILYGYENIPADWLAVLARRSDIEDLAGRLAQKHPD